MMLDDKELDRMLNRYTVPTLDADVVTQGIHNAMHRPAPMRHQKSKFRLFSPFPAFMLGGAVAVAVMVLFILPMAGLEITSSGSDIEGIVHDLARTEVMAQNEVKSADEIFSMLDNAPAADDQNVDELLKTLDNQDQTPDDNNAPIWDTFMGQS